MSQQDLVDVAVPEPDSASVLLKLREAKVVLDFILLVPRREAPDSELHRAAFIAGIEEASRLREVAQPPRDDDVPGRQIQLPEFYGAVFDRATGRLLMKPSSAVLMERQRRKISFPPGTYGPFTWSDSDDIDHLVWWPRDEPRAFGYAAAFSDPPRPVRLSHRGVQAAFAEANHAVLGDPDDNTTIFEWDGLRSDADYFSPGQDLSGAVAWTVSRSDGLLVFVGCSADEHTPFGFELPPGVTPEQFQSGLDDLTRRLADGTIES